MNFLRFSFLNLIFIFALFVLYGCGTVPRVPIEQVVPSPSINIDPLAKLEPIAFEKGIITLRRGEEVGTFGMTLNYGGDDITIEASKKSSLCTYRSKKLHWNTGTQQFGGREGEFADSFYQVMKSSGYDVVGDPKVVFERDEERSRATYKIAARVTDLKINLCEMGHWWDGRALGIYAGEAFVKVEWHIYSALKRKTTLLLKTDAYMKLEEAGAGGFSDLILGAFENAVRELASNREFYSLVSGGSRSLKGSPSDEEEIIISRLVLKNGINENIDQILKGTVTVRSTEGHGSGFVVDDSGLILTNFHVVGEANKATIIFGSGLELEGEVFRSNKFRDVALLRVQAGGLKAIPIRTSIAKEAEEVFAIGTPLGESLKSTVTKGIVSAIRTRERTGLQFIQSDADIHGGNSGGPLLDRNGNVVGISVEGIVGKDKLSAGINFFIPIMDALKWMNIKISGH